MKHRPPLPDDIKTLMGLVRAGKLFDVQKWIADGKRTVPPKRYLFEGSVARTHFYPKNESVAGGTVCETEDIVDKRRLNNFAWRNGED